MTRDRDQGLLDAAGDGDPTAFDRLVELYGEWCRRLAWRLTGSRADASDVTQDAFLHLLDRLPGLRLSGKLSTYLFPVVRNLAREARRKRARFQGPADSPRDPLLVLAEGAPADSPRPDLAAALAGLPEPQREALLLRVVEEFSVEEAAHALQVPPGTVKSRVHHALKALRADPRAAHFFDS